MIQKHLKYQNPLEVIKIIMKGADKLLIIGDGIFLIKKVIDPN